MSNELGNKRVNNRTSGKQRPGLFAITFNTQREISSGSRNLGINISVRYVNSIILLIRNLPPGSSPSLHGFSSLRARSRLLASGPNCSFGKIYGVGVITRRRGSSFVTEYLITTTTTLKFELNFKLKIDLDDTNTRSLIEDIQLRSFDNDTLNETIYSLFLSSSTVREHFPRISIEKFKNARS